MKDVNKMSLAHRDKMQQDLIELQNWKYIKLMTRSQDSSDFA